MALDSVKRTYRPDRPDTRRKTTYGSMSEWVRGPAATRIHRPSLPAGILALDNRSPKFTRKPNYQRGKTQYVYMRNSLPPVADPLVDPRRDALDDMKPVHIRYSTDCGYDDFHKAYRTAKTVGPQQDFPIWGPPRLRHGRSGGTWRHVREVLQAGGKRIVYVDGQVSTKDAQDIDSVPGGHLILADANAAYSDRPNRMQYGLEPSPRLQTPPRAPYGALTALKGVERNNWNIIR